MPGSEPGVKPPRDEVLSLNVLAGKAGGSPERLSQFRVLMRHFLDRFFGSELASADGDVKTRLVQAVCVIGLPPLVLSLYLYTPYHLPFRARSYWQQAGDHYFFVLYTMVAMGLVAIFEWDLLFPDLLDVFILSSLPVKPLRLLAARIAAILLLIASAVLASGFLAPLVLPAATDPPHMVPFLAGYCIAVASGGLFAATLALDVEALLLALFGDRWFRRVSLWIQGIAVVALLSSLFLYPVIFGSLPGLLLSGSRPMLCFPPFWFLGIYQTILGGGQKLPVLSELARMGFLGTAVTVVLSLVLYPLAWWRRTAGLVTGAAKRERLHPVATLLHKAFHAMVVREPKARAVWHFVGQNLLRVPRYRMVLVLYGGAGVSLVLACALRVAVEHGTILVAVSPEGLRAAVPVAAFWTVSGLRSTFLAPVDQRGRWVFRAVQGQPAWFQMQAARRWVFLWGTLLTLCVVALAFGVTTAPSWRAALTQGFVAVALSALLTDGFFLNVRTIPFTGTKPNSATNLALLMIPYLGFFPVIVLLTVGAESWLGAGLSHLAVAAFAALAAHLCMLRIHRTRITEQLQQVEADEDQEDFPMRLGLRY